MMSVPSSSVQVVQGDIAALSDLEKRMLAFEREWAGVVMRTTGGSPVAAWQTGGKKLVAISEEFGLSQTRYVQMLNQLIDKPAAMAEDPMTVRRLQRLRNNGRRRGRREAV